MNITGGESLSLFEAQEAADIVQDAADEDVNMIFGTVINPELQDEIVVTVILLVLKINQLHKDVKLQVLVSEQVQLQALQHKQSTPREESFSQSSSSSRSSESVSEKSYY